MSANSLPKSYSRKSAGVLLLVGVLVGVTVGGGVGVIAASTTKIVTVCADKKTNVLRYAKNSKCAKTETKVMLNQTGPAGATGAKGATGDTGATGTVGTGEASGLPATSVPSKIKMLASPSFPVSVGIGAGMTAVATPPSSAATSAA